MLSVRNKGDSVFILEKKYHKALLIKEAFQGCQLTSSKSWQSGKNSWHFHGNFAIFSWYQTFEIYQNKKHFIKTHFNLCAHIFQLFNLKSHLLIYLWFLFLKLVILKFCCKYLALPIPVMPITASARLFTGILYINHTICNAFLIPHLIRVHSTLIQKTT